MIKLGICTSIDNAPLMREIGYDCVELGLSGIAQMTEEDFQALLEKVKAAPLPVESVNGMLPGDFVLCSEEGTGARLGAYLDRAFSRAEALGVRIAVFGSGAARRLPEGMSETAGYEYLARFLRFAAEKAAAHGITIAIEPLRAAECNIINYVKEAQSLAALAAQKNVGALADHYHMMQGGDSYDALDNGIGILHAHIAEKEKRGYPKASDACLAEYEEFFRRLKSADYEGRVMIEGGCGDFAGGAKEAFALLDSLR